MLMEVVGGYVWLQGGPELLPFAISSGYWCHCRLEQRQSQGSEGRESHSHNFSCCFPQCFYYFSLKYGRASSFAPLLHTADDSLSLLNTQKHVQSKKKWSGGGSWRDGYLCLMCALRWKAVGDLPHPASLRLPLSLCLIHFIGRKWMRVTQCVKCVSLKQRTVWSVAHLCFSHKKRLLLLFFIAVIYDWSSHLIYHEWVCAHSLSRLVS